MLDFNSLAFVLCHACDPHSTSILHSLGPSICLYQICFFYIYVLQHFVQNQYNFLATTMINKVTIQFLWLIHLQSLINSTRLDYCNDSEVFFSSYCLSSLWSIIVKESSFFLQFPCSFFFFKFFLLLHPLFFLSFPSHRLLLIEPPFHILSSLAMFLFFFWMTSPSLGGFELPKCGIYFCFFCALPS